MRPSRKRVGLTAPVGSNPTPSAPNGPTPPRVDHFLMVGALTIRPSRAETSRGGGASESWPPHSLGGMPTMFEPAADALAYRGVPNIDAPLPLVARERCGEIVCRCLGDEAATSDLQESAQQPTRHVTWRPSDASSWPS